jgi:chromate reductase
MRIFLFSASMRKASFNKKLASLINRKLEALGCEVDFENDFHAFDMPLYDGDLDAAEGMPPGARKFIGHIEAADGIVMVYPEYNHSIPGPLKNAIDWISRQRPYPTIGKTVMLASAAPSPVGGYRGLMAMLEPMALLEAWVSPGKFGLALANKAFDDDGNLVNPDIDKLLDGMIAEFIENTRIRSGN